MKVSKQKLDDLVDELETKLEDIRTDNVIEYDAGQRSNVFITLRKVQTILEKET